MYYFGRAPVWRVLKVYISAAASALDVAETLIPPTKLSAPLKYLNANAVDALTTALVTRLERKHRHAEATSYAQEERAPG